MENHMMSSKDPHLTETLNCAKLIEAQPGDLILWDSRTIHGGLVGTPSPELVA